MSNRTERGENRARTGGPEHTSRALTRESLAALDIQNAASARAAQDTLHRSVEGTARRVPPETKRAAPRRINPERNQTLKDARFEAQFSLAPSFALLFGTFIYPPLIIPAAVGFGFSVGRMFKAANNEEGTAAKVIGNGLSLAGMAFIALNIAPHVAAALGLAVAFPGMLVLLPAVALMSVGVIAGLALKTFLRRN